MEIQHLNKKSPKGGGGLTHRCSWIGFIHGWIGLGPTVSDDCYVQNYDGLCFQLNRRRLFYHVIISDYLYI